MRPRLIAACPGRIGAPVQVSGAFAAAVLVLLSACGDSHLTTPPIEMIDYPDAPRGVHVDVYHGTQVADPYRWLEDIGSDETMHWVRAQDSVARVYGDAVLRRHSHIAVRVKELSDYPGVGDFVRRGEYYFYLETSPDLPQPILYAEHHARGTREVVVDPNLLSTDGSIAIGDYSPSPTGDVIAFALVRGGSRYFDWYFKDMKTGAALQDTLLAARIPVGPTTLRNPWTPDGSSFYYTRYADRDRIDETIRPTRLELIHHELGTSHSADTVVYSRPDDFQVRFDGIVTEDGAYLVVHERQEEGEVVLVHDLRRPGSGFQRLAADANATFAFLGGAGSQLFFQTNHDAPRGKVIRVDPSRPEPSEWETVVPQTHETLENGFKFDERLVLMYVEDVNNFVRVHDLRGQLEHRVAIPSGLVWNFYMRYWSGVTGGGGQPVVYIRNLGITSAGTIYRLDLNTGALSVERRSGTPFRIEEYETTQHFVTSRDGVTVPMFVTHRKGLELDGSAPTLLWVYGAFGFTARPYINPKYATFLQLGGVLAMPNIRGGGAYGNDWQAAGSRGNKTRSIEDAVAAAEWLIEQGYTSPSRLVIEGNSAGATVGGGALTQRPDLFGAAILEVPITDMLRAVTLHGGTGWINTFGTPTIESEFDSLYSYSPYHKAVPGVCYPPVFIAAGDLDVTAVPSHAYKMTAALQHANKSCEQENPILLRVDWGTDHGANKPQSNREAEYVAELTFLAEVLDLPER
ncbi:MAG: prolyl oligopeptidase family serine peptidase [Gemmatimonadota bacterium]